MSLTLIERIVETACVTGNYRLANGGTLDSYFDEYALAADPMLLRDVAHALAELVPADTDILAGLALGGVPLAVALSAITGLPAAFVRQAPKRYGTGRQVEGRPVAGARVLLVDDVVRSGAQSLAMTTILRAAGAQVRAAVCVLRRPMHGRETLAGIGVTLAALFEETDLTSARTVTVEQAVR